MPPSAETYEGIVMTEVSEMSQLRELHDAEFWLVESKLMDLKDRVTRLETTIARGVLLLVANLAGVVMTLAQDFLRQ